MTFDEIETALGKRLASMPGCPPIAWPNADAPGAVPYLEVQNSPGSRNTPTIDGSGPAIQSGIFLVTVVTARRKFTGQANGTAQAIADRFPKGLRLPVGDENVLIYRAAEPAPGFTDGTHYRLPVRIWYTTD